MSDFEVSVPSQAEMTVAEVMRRRRSIRHFTEEPVSAKELREMLQLASLAPNVGNRQLWRFIVLEDENLRRMLAGLIERRLVEMASWPQMEFESRRIKALRHNTEHFAQAPTTVLVIATGYHHPLEQALVEQGMKHWEIPHLFGHPDYQTIGSVIGFLTLLAAERGYGACWMTDVLAAKRDLQAALELKPGEEIAAAVALGHPAETPLARPRRPVDEIIEWR